MNVKIFICLFLEILLLVYAVNAQPKDEALNDDLKRKVTEQVERIKTISGISEWRFGELPATSSDPILELEKIGMVSIPYLIPYLSDTSPTQAKRALGNGRTRIATVNEYIGYIISRITNHHFYLSKGKDDEGDDDATGDQLTDSLDDPNKIREFQTQIADWYKKNKHRSLGERKLDDLDDVFHYNRLAAYSWLGQSKRKEYRLPLENKIKKLLKGEVNSSKDSEMVECARALSQIGDPKSTAVVRKVTDHLSYWIYMQYRPSEEGRSAGGSSDIPELFGAYKALAKLGQKKEALIRLKELERKYLKEMEQHTQNEFIKNLKEAEKW
ncbi:hypothetical protein [Leptospira weilii]|uniref:Uncharacterized protein n=1 Tax=Leptospira weilii str. UI 13098 TaxID=1088542 RepID=M6QRM3_9LEPT|nr:hypothetical protein [Leptospira weilii]EMN91472.1 hypothetical protein LEP1GSC108_3439 [Leptospira weilii str. UI 13098]OMI14314.1 hypothetical protein BUQ74_20840 [Leptospira weilii serovar Heyan]